MIKIPIIRRYLFSQAKKERRRNLRVLIGLSFSTMVLLSILSIMDYLHVVRFNEIKSVKSFPVCVISDDEEALDSLISEYKAVASCFKYKESQGVLTIGESRSSVIIRYVDSTYDGGLITNSNIGSILLLPYSLYIQNGAKEVEITTLDKGKVARVAPHTNRYSSFGVYITSLSYDFDSSHIFLPYIDANENASTYLAFKPFGISEEQLIFELSQKGFNTISWKEQEASLYGAMILEKNIMRALLLSLFLIIFVQVVQNSSIFAHYKRREIVSLYLMGYKRRDIIIISAFMAITLSTISFIIGILLTKVFLTILSYTNPFFSKNVLSLDLNSIPLVYIIFTMLSAAAYILFFIKQLRKESVREVINSI